MRPTLNHLLSWLGKGLLAVVPITLTIGAVVWLVTTAESLLAPMIRWVFGAEDYVPGSGLLLAAVVLVGVGILVEAVVGAWAFDLMERLVDRVPLVKSVYGAIRDVMRFVVPGQEENDARRVVAWQMRDDVWLVGFVTGAPLFDPGAGASADGEGGAQASPEGARVSVYFPMSYQIGGFTLVLREDDLRPLDMTVEEAMRSVLTAGVVRQSGPLSD